MLDDMSLAIKRTRKDCAFKSANWIVQIIVVSAPSNDRSIKYLSTWQIGVQINI